MPSRRRSRSKNLNNNLSDVQRRLRSLERRPVRTKLASRVVTKAAIAPNSVSEDEVSFGTAVVVPPGEDINDVVAQVENPKEGLLVVDTDSGESQVYSEETETFITIADPVAQGDASNAAALAALAEANAAAAQQTADGKNKVYRQDTQPSGGTYAVGDIWFDTDDNNKIYRFAGTPTPTWGAVQLGGAALANINANAITAGTIDASVITVSNINAGNITAGSIASARLTTTQLNATNITTGTLQGISIQTSATGNRIAMTNTDELQFFATDGTRIGTIGPTDYSPTSQEGLVLTSGVPGAADTARLGLKSDEFSSYAHLTANDFLSPSVILTYASSGATQRININGGGQSATDGSVDILAGQGGITIRSWTGDQAAADEISFNNEYANSGSIGIISDRIRLYGALVLGAQSVSQGTGAPSNYTGDEADANIGAIFFRYT